MPPTLKKMSNFLCKIQLSDPFCRTSGKHFDGLMQKYGAPVIVLNLVRHDFHHLL